MAAVIINAKYMDGARPRGWNSERHIEMVCEMTADQMGEAFGEFLKHVSDADLAEWIKRYELQDHFTKDAA